MWSVRHFPYSRLIELVNLTGGDIQDVRLRFATEGFGHGTVRIAENLSPNEAVTWSLKDQRKRVLSVTAEYRSSDGREHIAADVIRAPSRSYFRWLRMTIKDGGDLYGVGRAQGMPRPTHYPSGFGIEALEEIELDSSDDILITTGCDKSTPSTQFIELVSFASISTRVRFLTLVDADGNLHEIPADVALKPGAHFDLEIEMNARIRQLKVAYEEGSSLKAAYADFTAAGHKTFRYGSVLWDALSENISWMGQADFADDIASHGTRAPRVVVEEDPDPEYPDTFCGSPMRLKNLEAYRVHVRFSETFWNEGPTNICDPTRATDGMECLLPPKGTLSLGCSHYKTPNMWCSYNKRWRVIGANQVS